MSTHRYVRDRTEFGTTRVRVKYRPDWAHCPECGFDSWLLDVRSEDDQGRQSRGHFECPRCEAVAIQ